MLHCHSQTIVIYSSEKAETLDICSSSLGGEYSTAFVCTGQGSLQLIFELFTLYHAAAFSVASTFMYLTGIGLLSSRAASL